MRGVISIVIKHHIPNNRQGQYYTIDFFVPENVEKITVSYDYYRKGGGVLSDLKPSNTVDIGLEDEAGRFLGWSGSAHKTISVGEYDSSAGYLCTRINSGNWKIIVGAYHIMPQGVEVTYNIEFQLKQTRLLYGDLHIHSNASDGSLSAYEIGLLARKKGLDFVALANHNNFAENYSLPHIDGLTFIPAVEWTHYKGHINLFGVENPFENSFVANTKEEMHSLIDNAKSKGATVSVNHPKCRFCPYLWEDEDAFDMMEIWNGPMRKTNERAIEWWTSLLSKGRKIPIVGGSDFHKPKSLARLGNPVTAVYSPSPSKENILDSIRRGRAFVCEKADGLRLDLKYAGSVMGESANYKSEIPLKIEGNFNKAYLVTEQGETPISLQNGVAETFIKPTKFAYIKLYKGFGRLRRIYAVSNPIYFDEE